MYLYTGIQECSMVVYHLKNIDKKLYCKCSQALARNYSCVNFHIDAICIYLSDNFIVYDLRLKMILHYLIYSIKSIDTALCLILKCFISCVIFAFVVALVIIQLHTMCRINSTIMHIKLLISKVHAYYLIKHLIKHFSE